jgi:hypothetical protein
MGSFDVTQVAVFEHRVDAIAGRREHFFERGPPAHFLAQLQRLDEPFCGGEAPTDRAGNPAAGIVEGLGQFDQVEYGFLDVCPRRFATGLSCLGYPAGGSDHDSSHRDPPRRRNRHVDRLAWMVDESMQLSRSEMA